MLKDTTRGWVAATCLGFAVAFLSFIPIGAIMQLFAPDAIAGITPQMLPEHLDPASLPSWLDRPTYETLYRFTLLQHVIMYSVFGLILGSIQGYSLRGLLPRAWPWVLATGLGFVSILVLESVERHIVIGPHQGPLEPIIVALGGGSVAGFLQWLYLRRRGVNAWRWLLLWIVGLAVGIAAAALVLTLLGWLLEEPVRQLFGPETAERVGWWIFFGVYGAVVGAVAAWLSRRRILARLRELGSLAPPAGAQG